MGRPPSALTRREFIALGGGGAVIALIVGVDIAAHGSPISEVATPGLIANGNSTPDLAAPTKPTRARPRRLIGSPSP